MTDPELRAKNEALRRQVARLEAQCPSSGRNGSAAPSGEEMFFRDLIDLLPDAAFVADHDRRVVAINTRCAHLFGAGAPDDVIGRSTTDFVHPESRGALDGNLRELREGRTREFTLEVRRLRLDGTDYYAEVAASATQWKANPATLVVMRDITRRKRAERELVTVQMQLREAIETMPDGFVLWDANDRLVLCNSRYRDFFPELAPLLIPGVKFETIARAISETGAITGSEGREDEMFHERVRHHREPGKPLDRKLKDGRWMRINERRTEDGGLVSLRADITELKRREMEARASREDSEMANRAKSEFLANMSHELRTPLNAIIGFSEIMRNEMLGEIGNEHYREYVHDIHASGQHLLGIISDILDLSKIEAGREDLLEEVFDPIATVDSSVRLVAERAQSSRVDVSISITGDHPRLRADQRKVKQILLNLLSNAV